MSTVKQAAASSSRQPPRQITSKKAQDYISTLFRKIDISMGKMELTASAA